MSNSGRGIREHMLPKIQRIPLLVKERGASEENCSLLGLS